MTYKEMLEEMIEEEAFKLSLIKRNLIYPAEDTEIAYQKTLLKITLLSRELQKFN